MHLQQRINLLVELSAYLLSNDEDWQMAKEKASRENGWFIPEFIDLAVQNIATEFLQKERLTDWVNHYQLPEKNESPKNIGLIMAGNIPLVGFHDFLTLFISGNRQTIKPSSKDETLIRRLVAQLTVFDPSVNDYVCFAERLNGCEAYIATGSNNSARYFEYYFGKYPHIIRRNRTSVALLDGRETTDELNKLADDVLLYFGLGCRNVTKIYIPEGYDFVPLLQAFSKYAPLADFSRYKNNYDYQLTLLILNKKYYMSTESILLTENPSVFSPISVLNLEYYKPGSDIAGSLLSNKDIQCIVGREQNFASQNFALNPIEHSFGTFASQNFALNPIEHSFGTFASLVPFGVAQQPSLTDYADGVDTLQFLRTLQN